MKIFYSWQSDLDQKQNHYFIRDVLKEVVKQLNAELPIEEAERELELDHDTKNVPGMPDIAGTIFDKIAASTVFVPDLSFVAERPENNRKLPNPNVLIELGYALSLLGSDRVVAVMNTAYGTPNALPFDLKHKRHPIQYSLTSEESPAEAKKKLCSTFKAALAPIIEVEKYRRTKIQLSSNPAREEIFAAIMASDSKDDWVRTISGNQWKEITYFKKNVNLRFETDHTEEGIQASDFKEEWANKHPDPHATGYWCNLYYGSTLIDTFILVSVDGGRANLPLPKSRFDLSVELLNYKVAQIHDSLGTLADYMRRSGLSIEKTNTQ